MKKYEVFLAEDEPWSLSLLTGYIESHEQLELKDSISSGREALKFLTTKKYDLLILDIDLPYINGVDLIKYTRRIATHIIYITAFSDFAIDAFNLGVVDYILKPVSKERFNLAIKRFILQHRAMELDLAPPSIEILNTALDEKYKLTKKQIALCGCIYNGMSRAEIEHALNITPITMKTHLNHIYMKTIDQIEPNSSNKQGKMQRLTAFLHQIASPGYD